MITNQTHARKLLGKAKFTSAEGCMCVSDLSQASQHTYRVGNCPCFIPYAYAGLPLCSKKGARVHSLYD
jgi:hypothetical protein